MGMGHPVCQPPVRHIAGCWEERERERERERESSEEKVSHVQ